MEVEGRELRQSVGWKGWRTQNNGKSDREEWNISMKGCEGNCHLLITHRDLDSGLRVCLGYASA